jgi:hypothetical protein
MGNAYSLVVGNFRSHGHLLLTCANQTWDYKNMKFLCAQGLIIIRTIKMVG